MLQLSDFFAYSVLIRVKTHGKNRIDGDPYPTCIPISIIPTSSSGETVRCKSGDPLDTHASGVFCTKHRTVDTVRLGAI